MHLDKDCTLNRDSIWSSYRDYLKKCQYLNLVAVPHPFNDAYTSHFNTVEQIIETTPYPKPCKKKGYALPEEI